MRGIKEHNFPAFDKAAASLRNSGHDILDPAASFPGQPNPGRAACMRHDIMLILGVDGIIVLPEWQASPGARMEVAEAWAIDIPVYSYQTWLNTGNFVEIPQCVVTIPREDQYYRKLSLVGLSGFAEAGKDEVAQILRKYGWTRVAFADPLKKVATDMGWSGKKDDTGRRLLQRLGIAAREYLDPDVWVVAGERLIESARGPVVITDVRFPNELFMVRRRGGIMIRITRPGKSAVNEHVSERAVTHEDCDYSIINDGSLEDLERKVIHLFERRGLPILEEVSV